MKNWEKQEILDKDAEIKKLETKTKKIEESEQFFYKQSEPIFKLNKEEEFKSNMRLFSKSYYGEQTQIDHARSFLSHLGLLDIFSLLTGSPTQIQQLSLLNEADPDLKSMLEYLDIEGALRKSIKIGLIYVGRGQTEQKLILKNSKGTTKYNELLSMIGTPFNNSDLRKNQINKPGQLHYSTPTFELGFHVITLMVTNETDDQQLEKKKYVGNDSVHIVWNDNDFPYKPGTITGAFNFVHIIITPMRNGLYKIIIHKKKDNEKKKELVKFFGPLLTGMILPMALLPSLLRNTAISARKSIVFKQLQMCNSMTERRKALSKIVDKFSVKPKNIHDKQFLIVDKLMNCASK